MLKLKSIKRGSINFLQDKKEPLKTPWEGIEKLSLGKSVQERNIYSYRLGDGSRKMLFVSAMHGNEIGTIKLAYRLIEHLQGRENEYNKLTCFVTPCLNADGFEKARRLAGYFKGGAGRLNARKVDLNRNFPTSNFRNFSYTLPREVGAGSLKYRKEVSPDSAEAKSLLISQNKKDSSLSLKSCGEFGGSEPETKALIDFIEKEKISIIFSFHNTGRDVMGGKNSLSKELVKIYADKTGYEILDDAEWRKIGQTGTLKDWCDEQDISFVEIEGSTRYGSDWKIQKPALKAVLDYLQAH